MFQYRRFGDMRYTGAWSNAQRSVGQLDVPSEADGSLKLLEYNAKDSRNDSEGYLSVTQGAWA